MSICPKELREAYQKGRVVPFLGAGVSMSVTWDRGGKTVRGPSWKEVVDQAARELGFEHPDLARVRGTDLQILEYFKLKKSGYTDEITSWLTKNLDASDDAILASQIHKELAELSLCRLFYTTNFDDFLERLTFPL